MLCGCASEILNLTSSCEGVPKKDVDAQPDKPHLLLLAQKHGLVNTDEKTKEEKADTPQARHSHRNRQRDT